MRIFTFKGLFFTAVFMLLGCLSIQAADDDLITKQITIKLDEAGTLPDRIAKSKIYKITNLKLVGEINGTDLRMIREMAGRDYSGYFTDGKLSVLDLSEAMIVEGGLLYYSDYSCYTTNNEIGKFAFKGCSGLTSLTLPANIKWIGESAFSGCSGLTSLTLPDGVTEIGQSAFSACSGLTSLTLPSSIAAIGESAFSACSGLTSLTLPSSITTIGESAFCDCSGLTSLTLPSSITTIGENAFSGCSGLTSLTLPANIKWIGASAFYGCSGLTSLPLPANIEWIGASAFSGCSGLTSLTLPSSITTISASAFSGCSGLTSLTLPSNITEIGEWAFSNCGGLASIYVYAEKVPKMAEDVFKGCDATKCILYVPKGTYDDYFISNFGYFENIEEFEVTGIGKPTTSTDAKELSRYSVNGQRLVGPTKGLNIVKYSDGSVKKVVVQ